jgi:glycosyltransferase involved in cell wall biosynthesis
VSAVSENLGGRAKLAGVVITRNEQDNIARCLESLAFCDEIIVVDAESTDATREIAARFTAHVHNRPWTGYASQRNAAASLTDCDWVLSVDADEVVSDELRLEIQARLPHAERRGTVAFTVPRRTIHMGRWIRHGGWYPNRLVRLFRKSRGAWVGEEIHEYWRADGAVEALAGDLVHYSFTDLSDQVERNNRYSSLGAVKLHREGRHFSSLRLLTKTASKFIETYFLKRGFLDGYPGVIISVSAAYSVFLKWAKLWELERSEKEVGA